VIKSTDIPRWFRCRCRCRSNINGCYGGITIIISVGL